MLGECNLLAECLTPNWMLTNVASGEDVQVSAAESHDELGVISVGTREILNQGSSLLCC